MCLCVSDEHTRAPHYACGRNRISSKCEYVCVALHDDSANDIFGVCECANHLSVFVVVLQQSSMLPDVLSSLLVGSRFQVAGVLSPMKHFRCEMVKNWLFQSLVFKFQAYVYRNRRFYRHCMRQRLF